MPWGAAAAVGGALIGASATGDAADSQAAAAAAATAEQKRQFDLIRGDQAPYREAGVAALGKLAGFSDMPALTAAEVMAEPGYQFGLDQGRDAIQGSAAAAGGLYSGNALKALTRYGNDYATTKYGDAWNRRTTEFGNRWNRLAGLAGIGQTANQQSAQAGQNYANAVGGIAMSNANAQGAAGIARANLWGNALNSVASTFRRSSAQTPPSHAASFHSNAWWAGGDGFEGE